MRQNEESRATALDEIRAVMARRQQQHARLEQLLETFTSRLYEGFEQAVTMAQQAGIESINQVRYINHPAGGWRRALQIGIDDWRIVIVPLAGAAWPNANDEAMIPGAAFKEPSARLAFFLMQADDPQGSAFYDIIIMLNGAWFAWGYGWPKQQDDMEYTDFTALALDLLASFAKDIHLTWATRDGTTLANAMDAKRRVWRFGLPGQDEGPVRR